LPAFELSFNFRKLNFPHGIEHHHFVIPNLTLEQLYLDFLLMNHDLVAQVDPLAKRKSLVLKNRTHHMPLDLHPDSCTSVDRDFLPVLDRQPHLFPQVLLDDHRCYLPVVVRLLDVNLFNLTFEL
jgi:hypothetical protein